MNIKPQNLIEVTGAKAGQRAILKDGKAILVGLGGIPTAQQDSSEPSIDLSFVTATEDQILEGYVGVDQAGNPVEGAITVQKGTTITPSVMPIVYSNVYIDGNLTIQGDQNLNPSIIKKGQSLFGVVGEYEGSGSSSGSGGAFDIVKVTEYSPYVPAYPQQIGFVFDIEATDPTSDDGQAPYDASAYEGLYTVTEETKTCASFGRVYKNANGKYLYAFSYQTWGQATDDTMYAYWCIADSVGYGPDSSFISANQAINPTLPGDAAGWQNVMSYPNIKSCTVTQQVTAPATEAIPMVLKGSVASGYNTETKVWTDGATSTDYSGFEVEPYKNWYYTGVNNRLIGAAVGSNVPHVFYASLTNQTTTAETGQTLTFINRSDYPGKFNTVDGVPCYDMSADSANRIQTTSPSGVFSSGKPFAVSMFMRLNNQVWADKWALAIGTDSANKGFCIGYTGDMHVQTTGTGTADSRYISKKAYKGEWVHVFVVNHGDYEDMYINGVLDGTLNWKREGQDTGNMYLGSWFGTAGLEGYIAQIKIYNAVVSPAQIKNEADRCLALVTV